MKGRRIVLVLLVALACGLSYAENRSSYLKDSELLSIPFNQYSPDFGTTNDQIIFANRGDDGLTSLYLWNTTDQSVHRIPCPAFYGGLPDFDRESGLIYYSSSDADGFEINRTSLSGNCETVLASPYAISSVCPSPFHESILIPQEEIGKPQGSTVFVVYSSGGKKVYHPQGGFPYVVGWLDVDSILYGSLLYSEDEVETELYHLDLQTGESTLSEQFDVPPNSWSLSLSRDLQKLVYVTADEDRRLWVFDKAANEASMVYKGGDFESIYGPRFNQEGDRIVFYNAIGNNEFKRIVVIDCEGTILHQLTRDELLSMVENDTEAAEK